MDFHNPIVDNHCTFPNPLTFGIISIVLDILSHPIYYSSYNAAIFLKFATSLLIAT